VAKWIVAGVGCCGCAAPSAAIALLLLPPAARRLHHCPGLLMVRRQLPSLAAL
jgi:hypothetical protein